MLNRFRRSSESPSEVPAKFGALRIVRLGVLILALAHAVSTATAAVVTRGPYLQSGTPSSMTIRWRTDEPAASEVRYGSAVATQNRAVRSEALTTEHELTIAGLTPDSETFYTISDGVTAIAGGDGEHSFRTSPLPGTVRPVRLWILGDSGTGGDGTGRAEAVRDAYLESPLFRHNDLWLMLGDNAYYTGRDHEYQLAVFETYPTLLRNTVLWPALGNHETYGEDIPYFDIFNLPRNGEAGGVASGTEHYYSFNFANIHLICLDSMISARTPGSAMLQWLEDDLAATTQKWIIAYWHHPPYTRGSHNSDTEFELIEMRQHVLPILEAGGVDLVLTGHSHSYERSFLLDGHYGPSTSLMPAMIKDHGDGRGDGDGAYGKDPVPRAGAVYIVAGSSGQGPSGGPLNHPVMFTSINQLGSLLLDIDGDELHAQFLNVNGAIRDHFSISKAPLVTVSTTRRVTREENRPPAVVTLSRTRGIAAPVSINLTIGGTATPGADYQTISSPFTIPAGVASLSFNINPIADELVETTETVVIAAGPGQAYRLQRDQLAATLEITDEQWREWRLAHFGEEAGDPEMASRNADADDDGQTNEAEFLAGTDPRNGARFFKLSVSAGENGSMTIRFRARANRTYTVQFNDSLSAGTWQKLADVPAEPQDRQIIIQDPAPEGQARRFYRVVAPEQP